MPPPPVIGYANDDSYLFPYNGSLFHTRAGFLNNDTDLDFSGDLPAESMNYIAVSGPHSGVLVVNNNWSFTYTPNAGVTYDELVYKWEYESLPGQYSTEAVVRFYASGVAPAYSGGLPAYIRGHAEKSRPIPLFVSCLGSGTAATTLFARGHAPASGSAPLHTTAHGRQTGSASLFVKNSTVGSGNLAAPLFLLGVSSGVDARGMNLWVGGCAYRADAAVSLFAQNNDSGVYSSVPLFVSGQGSLEGGRPGSGNMILYIERTPAGGIPLYVQGTGTPAGSGQTLFTRGGNSRTGSAPLYTTAVGRPTKSGPLFTIGF